MALIKNANNTFRGRHSVYIRIWHWCNFLVITLLLISVLLGFTLLKTRYNISLFQQEIKKAGASLTADQAKTLAKSLSRQLWQWHTYLGYALAVLFLFRIIKELTGNREEKIIIRIRKAIGIYRTNKNKANRHFVIVKLSYLLFYALLFFIILTGLGLAFANDFAFLKSIKGLIKDVHYYLMYSILIYALLHITGVVLAELNFDKGIVSDMINGGEESVK
jgi:Ni/Fe-hydrogenase 1 B-type cytochrome subunit